MMPQMDGIETTHKLRGLGYTGVIVALTANALVGNDEMFMKEGFDGFIPKPIDIRQLNAVLNKFIRDRRPEEAKKYGAGEVKGQAGPPQVSPKMLQIFRRDAEKAVAALLETSANGDLKLFTTTAHAMKSALANVNEPEASKTAAELENAGIKGDSGYIAANTAGFIKTLEELIERLRSEEPDGSEAAAVEEDTAYLAEELGVIKAACEDYDAKTAYAAFDRIKEKQWNAKTAAFVEEIRDLLYLDSDFDKVAEMIDSRD
jgi:DNA-binding response OmpR family regulator